MFLKAARYFCLFLFCVCFFQTIRANESTDSLKVSFITCSPGNESYELYGHTAIRIQNFTTGEDWVFNYGIFSFQKPHFLWRFILGKTDYVLGVESYSDFMREYALRQRNVYAQVLNLAKEEAAHLYEALIVNAAPENCTYRYNFLTNNCTTKAVEMITGCLNGRLALPNFSSPVTYRKIIHQFSAKQNRWLSFGQDLLLGSDVDTILSKKARLSFPLYAEEALRKAYVIDDNGKKRPLILSECYLLKNKNAVKPLHFSLFNEILTPTAVSLVIFILSLAGLFGGMRHVRKKNCLYNKLYDALLLLLLGLPGCIVFIMYFFSTHPAVDSNHLVILFNPLPLLFLPLIVKKHEGFFKFDYYWMFVYPCQFICFVIFKHGQDYPLPVWVFAVALLLRSEYYYRMKYISSRRGRRDTAK